MFNLMYSRQHQWKILDHTRRRAHIKFEIKNKALQSLLKSSALSLSQRHLAAYRKSTLPRASSITRVVNRCTQTGRKYSVIRRFQLSRFAFRSNSYEGFLPGVRRHSW